MRWLLPFACKTERIKHTMTDQEKSAFFIALTQLAGVIKNAQLSAAGNEMWFKIFRHFELNQIEEFFIKAAVELTFFPAPNEMLKLIQGSAEERAKLAWIQMIEACEGHGFYDSLFTDDASLAACIRHVFKGWLTLGELIPAPDHPMYTAKRKEFIEMYCLSEKRGDAVDTYFFGYLQLENSGKMLAWREGREEYRGRIALIVGGRLSTLPVLFRTADGALTDASFKKLPPVKDNRGGTQPPAPALSLPGRPDARRLESGA